MTKAQQALMEMAQADNPMIASAAIDCILKFAPTVCDTDPKEITKATNGMVDGGFWTFSMGEAYGIALKHTEP